MEGTCQEVASTLLSWGALLREAASGSFPLWLGHLAFCSSSITHLECSVHQPGRESNPFMKAAISGFPQTASSTDKWLLCNAVYGLVSGNGISLPFRCSCHRKHIYFFSSVIFSTKLHKSLYLSKCIGNTLLCIYSAAQVLHERKNKYDLLGKMGGESKGSRDSGEQNLVFTDSKLVCMYCPSVPVLCWLVRGSKILLLLHPQLWQLLPTSTWTHICLWLSGETEDEMWKSFLTLLHSYMLIARHGAHQPETANSLSNCSWFNDVEWQNFYGWKTPLRSQSPTANPAPPSHIPKCCIHASFEHFQNNYVVFSAGAEGKGRFPWFWLAHVP